MKMERKMSANDSNALAALVLEQVTRAMLKAGRQAADDAAQGKEHPAGLALAYYDALDVIKEQVQVCGYRFGNDLDAFDPDELLLRMAPKRKV